MRIVNVFPIEIRLERIDEPIQPPIRVDMRINLEKVEKDPKAESLYKMHVGFVSEYKKDEKNVAKIETKYLIVILREENENINEDVLRNAFWNILTGVWYRIAGDLINLAERSYLPPPIPLPIPKQQTK